MVDATMSDETKKGLLETIPMERPGETNDMAGLVLFLASKVCHASGRELFARTHIEPQAGSYIDGGVHIIDGGRMLNMPSTA